MVRVVLGVILGVVSFSKTARAEGVPPAPSAEQPRVAPPPHSIAVGDTILVPRSPESSPPRRARFAAPAPRGERHWYGLPILAMDGAAYGLLATAAIWERGSGVTLPLAVTSFALGGPVVHVAHGQWGDAGLSLLSRVGLPLGGAALGASGCVSGGGDCLDGVVGLAVLGMVTASVLDAAVLAYQPSPRRAGGVQPWLSLGAVPAGPRAGDGVRIGDVWLGARGSF